MRAAELGVCLLALSSAGACSSEPSPAQQSGGSGGSAAGASGSSSGGLSGGQAGASGAGSGGGGMSSVAGGPAGGTGGAAGSAGGAGSAGSAPCSNDPFALMSPEFGEGETIAEKFRCSRDVVDKPGVNVSPRLSWSCGPEGTQSYAVTMIHVGSQTLHWVLWDIPATVRELPEGVERLPEPPVPAGSKQNEPDVDGSTWYGYSGPCPGSPNQSYTFFVYALDVATLPGVTTDSTPLEVDAVIKSHDLAVETLTGGGSP